MNFEFKFVVMAFFYVSRKHTMVELFIVVSNSTLRIFHIYISYKDKDFCMFL